MEAFINNSIHLKKNQTVKSGMQCHLNIHSSEDGGGGGGDRGDSSCMQCDQTC